MSSHIPRESPTKKKDSKKRDPVQGSRRSPEPYDFYTRQLEIANAIVIQWEEKHNDILETLTKERARTDHKDEREKDLNEWTIRVELVTALIHVYDSRLLLLEKTYLFSDETRTKVNQDSIQMVAKFFPWEKLSKIKSAAAHLEWVKEGKPFSLENLKQVFAGIMKESELAQVEETLCKTIAEQVLIVSKELRDKCH